MLDWISQLLLPNENPTAIQSLIVMILTIGLGVFLGNIKIKNTSLGVSAVMFAGLFLGHYGYRMDASISNFIKDLGLIFFVYAIGLQLGPSFFSAFKAQGLKYNILAASGILLSTSLAFIIFLNTDLGIENTVGILSGSVTSTPALGAAKNMVDELRPQFPDRHLNSPAIGYAITYPMGVLGVIFSIILARVLLKIDPQEELVKFRERIIQRSHPILPKKCRITNPHFVGKTIREAIKEIDRNIIVTHLKRSGTKGVITPESGVILNDRDVLMIVGTEPDVDFFISQIGRISSDSFIEGGEIMVKNLFVTKKTAVHKKLSDLDLFGKYDLKITRIFRAGEEILARPSLVLFYGDKIRVVGKEESIQKAKELIGDSEKVLLKPDFLSLFGGILLGILIGSIPIFVPSMPLPIKLGFAAGPLLAALIISRYGRISFIYSYFNNGGIHFMRELGICFFFASLGITAGAKFYDNFIHYNGWLWLFYGSIITLVPCIFIILVGRFYYKLDFLSLSGLISGAYTDTAALSFSTSYLDSDIPVQAYAQVYPMVTILRIFIAQMLILLFI